MEGGDTQTPLFFFPSLTHTEEEVRDLSSVRRKKSLLFFFQHTTTTTTTHPPFSSHITEGGGVLLGWELLEVLLQRDRKEIPFFPFPPEGTWPIPMWWKKKQGFFFVCVPFSFHSFFAWKLVLPTPPEEEREVELKKSRRTPGKQQKKEEVGSPVWLLVHPTKQRTLNRHPSELRRRYFC